MIDRDVITDNQHSPTRDNKQNTDDKNQTAAAAAQPDVMTLEEKNEEDIMEVAFKDCACVIMVETNELLNSIWFTSDKLRKILSQIALKENTMLRLQLEKPSEEESGLKEVLSGDTCSAEFDFTEGCAPWEPVVSELKQCCQLNSEEEHSASVGGIEPLEISPIFDRDFVYLGI